MTTFQICNVHQHLLFHHLTGKCREMKQHGTWARRVAQPIWLSLLHSTYSVVTAWCLMNRRYTFTFNLLHIYSAIIKDFHFAHSALYCVSMHTSVFFFLLLIFLNSTQGICMVSQLNMFTIYNTLSHNFQTKFISLWQHLLLTYIVPFTTVSLGLHTVSLAIIPLFEAFPKGDSLIFGKCINDFEWIMVTSLHLHFNAFLGKERSHTVLNTMSKEGV
jgi:hypothetical protein